MILTSSVFSSNGFFFLDPLLDRRDCVSSFKFSENVATKKVSYRGIGSYCGTFLGFF